jgi:glucokinase
MRYVVGVDIGGTNVVVGTGQADGHKLFGRQTEPTDLSAGPGATVDQVNRLVAASLSRARAELGDGIDVVGVGVGSPGPLDTHSGTVLLTPNLGWTEMPLRDRVATAAGLPTTLDNDANCAVLGEWWRGAAQGGKVVVGLTIGTGIGGGIVLDGKVYHGANDCAGEIGHVSIDQAGRQCKCGNYGCLEAYASGPAIARRAVEGLEAGADSRLREYVECELTAITARTVSQAARDGDEFCLEVIRETAHYLGGAIANLVNTFNPDTVVETWMFLAGESIT